METNLNTLRYSLEQTVNCMNTEIMFANIRANLNAYGADAYGPYIPIKYPETHYKSAQPLPKKTNCVNCGAPLQWKFRCEYCGTVND